MYKSTVLQHCIGSLRPKLSKLIVFPSWVPSLHQLFLRVCCLFFHFFKIFTFLQFCVHCMTLHQDAHSPLSCSILTWAHSGAGREIPGKCPERLIQTFAFQLLWHQSLAIASLNYL